MGGAAMKAKPTKTSRRKPRRKDLKPGEVLCSYCAAKCCRYIALAIDTPECWADFEYIRWYLLHERAAVFTEEDTWYLLVYNRCKHLGEDNLCKTYETRPQICRDYTTKNCELRRPVGLRSLLGDARAGRAICRSRPGSQTGPRISQPQTRYS